MEMLTSGSPQGFTRHRCAISMSVGIARRCQTSQQAMDSGAFAHQSAISFIMKDVQDMRRKSKP